MSLQKTCENGDGVGNFVGFGHVFCWRCYSVYMKETYGLTLNVLDGVDGASTQRKTFTHESLGFAGESFSNVTVFQLDLFGGDDNKR